MMSGQAMGGKGAWQWGNKNDPERSLRIRDFERGRSSLGKKHKVQLGFGAAAAPSENFKHDPKFHKVATFEGIIVINFVFIRGPRSLGSLVPA